TRGLGPRVSETPVTAERSLTAVTEDTSVTEDLGLVSLPAGFTTLWLPARVRPVVGVLAVWAVHSSG
ncbi:uncharacterized protein METZ01_LOCUS421352, partial [marine metagenome]